MPSGVYDRSKDNKGWFKKGCKMSTITKKKMSKAQRGNINGFQKGEPSWNKGKKMAYKPRPCLKGKSTWNKGKELPPMPIEIRLKISEHCKENKNHLWKGGITSINAKIRNSIEYRLWREAVYRRDNYTCQDCHKRGGRLNADHIKPFALYPELRFEIENGRTLCIPCHKKTNTFLNRWSEKIVASRI